MKKVKFCIYTFLFVFFSSSFWASQLSPKLEKNMDLSTLQDVIDSVQYTLTDTIVVSSINSPQDSIPSDTISSNQSTLDAPVDYTANDSIIFTADNWGHLYGESNVNYQTLSIKGEKVSMNLDSSTVYASYGIDTLGHEFGFPVFKDGDTEYEMKSVNYNFKTKKGFIKNVVTQQGEGYIVAELAKKNADDSFFMCDGKYTTCDQHEHPHFYMMLTKAKVRPKKDVVTGPAYLVIEGLPLPLAIPFGFFPFTGKYSSGVIMPSYGDDMDRGFSLRNGGYYFAINDYVDLALTGEIYTKGSWGISARSQYKKRYKFNGSFDFNYMYTKYGDRDIPSTFSEAKDYRINWTHSQDPKANMYRTLSANVSYSTSSFNRYNQESLYSLGGTANTKSSSVTLTQRFPNSPFSMSANVTANQVTADSTVSLTLPNMTITMSRIYPFKRKNAVGSEKWYEKIQMSYTGDLKNSVVTKDNELLNADFKKDWKTGMQHRIPVSATFSLFNYINVTPSFNYTERWYKSSVSRRWNAESQQNVVADTAYGFYRSYDYNYNVGMQTILYGFYEPKFKIGKIKTIRHVFTPSISFGGNPDFSDPKYGSYKSYNYIDANGKVQTETYSPFSNQMFSPPSAGQNASVNFAFDNNLEMKVATDNDSTKIISLIDNFNMSFNYNAMGPKGGKWSNINTNLRLKLSRSLMVNIAALWDPYDYKWDPSLNTGVRDGLKIANGNGFARLVSTGYSISPSFNQDTFKKWFKKGDKKDNKSSDKKPTTDNSLDGENEDNLDMDVVNNDSQQSSLFSQQKESGEYDSNGYLRNEVKWNLGISYSMSYNSSYDNDRRDFKGVLTHNLSFNGSIQPTKNWSFTFLTSYDVKEKNFPYVNCTLSRNLHCWNLSASFIPFGPQASYYVSLIVNSSMLQDLKYEQRNRPSSYDPAWD